MENNSNYGIWFFVLICLGFFSLNRITNYIEAKQSNGYNSEVYLRKISLKLEELYEQIKPYNENWQYDFIKAKAEEAELKASMFLEQVRLYDTGKIRTGIIASFIPDIFLNYEESSFDSCNEVIMKYYALEKNYTKEHLELLKKTLLDRTSMASWQRDRAIFKIELELNPIIGRVIADYILQMNDYKTPANLSYLIGKHFKHGDKTKLKAILNKLIQDDLKIDSYILNEFIRKTCIENFIESV